MRRRRHIIVALAMVAVLAVVGGILLAARGHRNDRSCENNLRQIYQAVVAFAAERGTMPSLALYPDDPASDSDSLLVVLREYGIDESNLLCPATDHLLQAAGNTYLWNTRLSGKALEDLETPQWMLVEINAMSSRVPAPHYGHYHVLYTDGEIRGEETPPAVL